MMRWRVWVRTRGAQQPGDLVAKAVAQLAADPGIVAHSVEKLGVGLGVEEVIHRPRMARAFASVSSSGTPCTVPFSNSARRR